MKKITILALVFTTTFCLGFVFFKCKDPKATFEWYEKAASTTKSPSC